jgi:uncharacterized membrane protein YcaP (DUF421 family)
MFFDDWYGIARVAVLVPLAYLAVVAVLRISGKRTLTKLNAFDLVVTVALGSTLSSMVLTSNVAYAEGTIAVALLVIAQYIVAKASIHSRRARRAVKSQPTLLLRDGRMLDEALEHQRVTRGEVLQAIRSSGAGDVGAIAAVVLETDGSLNVVPQSRCGDGSALRDVSGAHSGVRS